MFEGTYQLQMSQLKLTVDNVLLLNYVKDPMVICIKKKKSYIKVLQYENISSNVVKTSQV